MFCFYDWLALKEKWSHFDLKSWVTGGTKIRPGIPSNWRIFELNWLTIESPFELTHYWESIQIDSLLRVHSNWLTIESPFKLTHYWESIRIDSLLRVHSNWLNIESIWLKYSPITRNPGSNFSSASDSIF